MKYHLIFIWILTELYLSTGQFLNDDRFVSNQKKQERPFSDFVDEFLNKKPQDQRPLNDYDEDFQTTTTNRKPQRFNDYEDSDFTPKQRKPQRFNDYEDSDFTPKQRKPQKPVEKPRPPKAPIEKKRPQAPIPIITKQLNQMNEDGSYTFGYESDDGSYRVETRGVDGVTKGKYGFIDARGMLREVEYSAGGGYGYVPAGDDIRVPPPRPIIEQPDEREMSGNERRRVMNRQEFDDYGEPVSRRSQENSRYQNERRGGSRREEKRREDGRREDNRRREERVNVKGQDERSGNQDVVTEEEPILELSINYPNAGRISNGDFVEVNDRRNLRRDFRRDE